LFIIAECHAGVFALVGASQVVQSQTRRVQVFLTSMEINAHWHLPFYVNVHAAQCHRIVAVCVLQADREYLFAVTAVSLPERDNQCPSMLANKQNNNNKTQKSKYNKKSTKCSQYTYKHSSCHFTSIPMK